MTEETPTWMNPFVLDPPEITPERGDVRDLYPPDAEGPRPAIVFVHGGPIPEEIEAPRDWPVYRGYGALAASRGFMGVTFDHRLHDPDAYPHAYEDVEATLDAVRADPRVDADRIAVWLFSGGAPFSAELIRNRPSWLRVLALTYPLLGDHPRFALPERFLPAAALAEAGDLPIVLTTVGKEREELAAYIEPFLEEAELRGVDLGRVHVPNGRHGFDHLDHDEESRAAVDKAFGLVAERLG